MQVISTVDRAKRHMIKKVEFVGLKPRKPRKFKVELWTSMINSLHIDLFIQNWDPQGDPLQVFLEGDIPLEAIPEFSIDFKCFLKFDDCNNDARDAVASALIEVLTKLPTARVVIAKKGKKVLAKLFLGKIEMKGAIEPDWWIDHLFQEA